MGKINICIVHFNTPKLTECLVKSINKFVPDSTIYIFDNSNEKPFTYRQSNLVYFDNTRGQIIDFDKWLQKYPNRMKSPGRLNKWGSAKHAYTIEKLFDLVNDNFILLDSDVLLKADISPLFDDRYIYISEIIEQPKSSIKRVTPYVCFINVKLCKQNKVHYFNDKRMHGLFTAGVNSDYYDTGSNFYLECTKFPHKEIKFADYCVHYGGGSWIKEKRSSNKFANPLSENQWLMRNSSLWNEKKDGEFLEYEQKLIDHLKRTKKEHIRNIKNPKTIQEKIQWMKIHDSTSLKTKCSDKIKIHDYCKEKLGEDICIPILKVYKSPDEIKWSELPNSFVLKCNHGSGMNIIVDDKSKVSEAASKEKIRKWLATDFAFQNGCEMQYHNIQRKAYVEQFMFDEKQKSSLYDYKFWCFNGTPKFMTVNDGHGHGRMNFYDMQFNQISLKRTDFEPLKEKIEKPTCFDKMVELSKKLSEDFKFVRVDFYIINGKIYLGELTFTPGSGTFAFAKKEDNLRIGKMLNLGIENNKVIYTCITGAYELLDDPFVVSEGYDYVCFTNYDKIKSSIWEIRPIPAELNGLSEVKKQRCIKVNAHKYLPEYDFSIWVDGSVKLKKDVNEFVRNNCSNGHIFIPTHPLRKCIYEEMNACIKQKKDTAANIEPQRAKYLKEGFPKNFGLVQSNIMLRYHNEPDCIKLMETWWKEIENGSHRDQLSFDYARWKNPDARFVFIDKNTCKTNYFNWDNTHGKGKVKKFIQQQVNPTIMETIAENKKNEVKKVSHTQSRIQSTIKRRILSAKLKEFLNQN